MDSSDNSSCASSVASSSPSTQISAPLPAATVKRTRKRFTQEQVMILEEIFHRTSHPSREEREAAARQTGMDLKSITIWFQNKRQTERKVALSNALPQQEGVRQPLAPFTTSTTSTIAFANKDPLTRHRTVLLSFPTQTSSTKARSTSPKLPREGGTRRLSLDRVASRSELPPTRPRTLSRGSQYVSHDVTNPKRSLWEDMPSSPILPNVEPSSPSTKDYVDFATSRKNKPLRRSLEWACATARLSGKSAPHPPLEDEDEDATIRFAPPPRWGGDEDTDVDSICSEQHEAITPDCSQASIDVFIPKSNPSLSRQSSMNVDADERKAESDIMDAAWALCGLSQMS